LTTTGHTYLEFSGVNYVNQEYNESLIVKILKEVEAGRLVKEVCREYGISDAPTTTGNRSTAAWKLLT